MADTMPQPGFLRSPKELGDILSKMEHEGYNLNNLDRLDQRAFEKLRIKGETAAEEINLLKKIDPSINGNVVDLLEDLTLYRQENAAKRRWNAWEFVKSVPRRIWGTIKAHPKVSIAIGIAALLALAYFTGVGGIVVDRIRDYATKKLGAAGIAQAPEAAAKVGAEAAGTATEALEGAKSAMGKLIEATPMKDLPIPTTPPAPGSIELPSSLEEANAV